MGPHHVLVFLNKIAKRAQVGACGGQYIASGSNATGNFAAIYCVADAVLDFTDGTTKTEGDVASTVDIAIKAGVTVFGNFTQVVVKTSGGVIAYNNC